MLKPIDMKLLSGLRKNARQTLTEMSKQTGIPISTLFERLKKNEENIIMKHTALLDFTKLGFNCRANILLRTNRDNREKLGSYLKIHPSINNLYKVNNGYDFMAEGVFQNVKEMEDFMEELDNKFELQEKKTHYIIEDLKREEFLSNNQLLRNNSE